MSQLHHGNAPWSPPAPWCGDCEREKSGSWQLPSLRDYICMPELLVMEQKRIYVGKEAGSPWMVMRRFHGDAWHG